MPAGHQSELEMACHVAGIAHLLGSLKAEPASQTARVGVHCLSPGMVLTNLLLEGASDANKQVCYPQHFSKCPCQLLPIVKVLLSRRVRAPSIVRLVTRGVTCPLHFLVQEQAATFRRCNWLSMCVCHRSADFQHPVRAAGDGGGVPGATSAHSGRARGGRPLHSLPHPASGPPSFRHCPPARQPLLQRRWCVHSSGICLPPNSYIFFKDLVH